MKLLLSGLAAGGLVLTIATCDGSEESGSAENDSTQPTNLKAAAPTPMATCGPSDNRTNRDASVVESATLRVGPAAQSGNAKLPVGDEMIDATIDESVPVRELCRSGNQSFVRILLPEELRKVQGWAPSATLHIAKTRDDGRRIYTASYFEWQAETDGMHDMFVRAANRITGTDANCEAIDPVSALVEPGAAGLFSLICVGPRGSYPVQFTANRIIGGRPPLAADIQPIAKAAGYEPCVTAIEGQLAQPRTAKFDRGDITYSTDGGRARLAIPVTANNRMGLPIDLIAECVFEGEELTSAKVLQQ